MPYYLTPPLDSVRIANAHTPPRQHYHLPQPRSSIDAAAGMTTQHRGLTGPALPPPAGIPLPETQRGPPSVPPSLGQLPPAPQSWHGADQSMRDWLFAKAEEDKRRQEEERTRQEELRLEVRRTEQSILRDAIEGGVPSHLIPVIFAGLGSAPLSNLDGDVVRQLMTQLLQANPNALTQAPPIVAESAAGRGEHHRGPLAPAATAASYPPGQAAQPPSGPHGASLPASNQSSVYPSPAYPPTYSSPAHKTYGPPAPQYGPSTGPPRNPAQASLPRLTTGEPSASGQPTYSSQLEHPSPSPNVICFQHWQPPQQSKFSSKDSTQKTSPNVPSKLAGEEMRNSPRKRKTSEPGARPAPPKGLSPTASSSSSASNRPRHADHSRGASGEQREARKAYDPIERESRHSQAEAEPPHKRARSRSPR